jgi:hypothetical protein
MFSTYTRQPWSAVTLIGCDAGDDVGRAAGRKRDHNADGTVRVAARARLDHRTSRDHERRCKDDKPVLHVASPSCTYFPSNSGDFGQTLGCSSASG